MTVYERVRNACEYAQKNNFWDAWGIVASPITIYELRAECLEYMTAYKAESDELEKIFGLVVIPCECVEKDKMYIVDEMFGRSILGQTERSE